MQFFYQTTTDSAFNLALEELLVKDVTDELFFLWQNSPAVIIGRNQNTLAEINTDFIRANNINVTRRNTGGGAVYHDLGNVNYSYITNFKEGRSVNFADFAIPVIKDIVVLWMFVAILATFGALLLVLGINNIQKQKANTPKDSKPAKTTAKKAEK